MFRKNVETSSLPIAGNKPVTILPLDEENNENEINDWNETINIPPSPSNDVEFDIPDVQVPVPSSDEEDCYTTDSQETQPDPDPIDNDLLTTPMVNYIGDLNALANELN